MDFYKTKQAMQEKIKSMMEAGSEDKDIVFAINELSGLGHRFTKRYIEELKERGFGKNDVPK